MGFLSLQILPSSAAKSVGTHKNHQRGKVGQSAGDTAMSLSNWKITEFLNLIHSPVLGQSMTEFFQESNLSLWSLGTRDWNLAFTQEVWGGRLDEQDCSGSSLPFPAGWATVTMSNQPSATGEKKKHWRGLPVMWKRCTLGRQEPGWVRGGKESMSFKEPVEQCSMRHLWRDQRHPRRKQGWCSKNRRY